MRKVITTIGLFVFCISINAQIEGTSIPSLPQVTAAEMASIIAPNIGSSIFNVDDQKVYNYTTSGWIASGDEQVIDVLSFNSTNGELSISLENDGLATQTLDLSSLISQNLATDNLTQDGETRTFDMNGQDLNFSNGSFGVGTTNPSGTFEARSASNENAFYFVQGDGLTGERDVFTIEDQDNGGGSQDHSSVFKVVKSGNISNVDEGFSLVELVNTGNEPGANKYWISGRKTDEGAPLWGVDINDSDFWSEGGINLGATGAADGTYSGGTFNVDNSGQITSSDLSGVGTRMVVADASGVLSAQNIVVNTDNQFDDEVNLRSPLDMDEGGIASPTNETTVQEALQAIAPITSASGRIFYPPSIAIDASTNGAASIDLYQAYLDQFDAPVASSEAVDIPTYGRTELYYYVTYADPNVFGNGTAVQNMAINTNGVLSYEIFNQPADYNSLINVVFVVK